MHVGIIFPHQLFKKIPFTKSVTTIYLVEEDLYFNQYPFHKQKIILHRASMKAFEVYLNKEGYTIKYIEASTKECQIKHLIASLAKSKTTTVEYINVVDNWLDKHLTTALKKNKLASVVHETENFLNTQEENISYQANKKTYFQTDFYTKQRIKRNVLIETNQKPVGGQWTFDADNRAKLPKDIVIPKNIAVKENEFIKEAIAYTNNNFKKNYGNSSAPFAEGWYATTHKEANEWLQQFLKLKFKDFGIYEDAMHDKAETLFHSVLTPMLNIGLLTPQQVLNATLNYAEKNSIPLNSLEGFIRQIMGWREFIRLVYDAAGNTQRTKNYWGFNRQIPKSFYDGTTGIIPVDTIIKKLLHSGYNHHIERLMILGNFFLLCEFDPNAVHQWFMEMYVDAYDWVMVPNTYGMTQFADGGLMTTKPYISGSNYLMKMGAWPKGEWQQIWDGLFWRFMHVHRDFFTKNPRLGMLIGTFDKMDQTKRTAHLKIADDFLQKLDSH
jgi:deoxyribodipyrimidine photolyase-related protein